MWTGTVGPFQGRSDSSDFYVEPQMYLILYTETDLHTVRMHESSCLSPKHGRDGRVSGRPWLSFQGLRSCQLPGSTATRQASASHLSSGVTAQWRITTTPRFSLALWKAFLGSWDCFSESRCNSRKTASDFRKGKKKKKDSGPHKMTVNQSCTPNCN